MSTILSRQQMGVAPAASAGKPARALLEADAIQITRLLWEIACLLILLSLAGQIAKYFYGYERLYGLVQLFHLDQERNIPSVYAALLLFSAALILGVITAIKRNEGDRDAVAWTILAVGFVFMSFDEAVSLHERLAEPIKTLIGARHLGLLYFVWVVPGLALVGLVGLLLQGFLRRLPAATARAFIGSGAIYLSGALGMEMLGGFYFEGHGGQNFTYVMLTTLEESLEMFGVILFIRALLLYLARHYRGVGIRLSGI